MSGFLQLAKISGALTTLPTAIQKRAEQASLQQEMTQGLFLRNQGVIYDCGRIEVLTIPPVEQDCIYYRGGYVGMGRRTYPPLTFDQIGNTDVWRQIQILQDKVMEAAYSPHLVTKDMYSADMLAIVRPSISSKDGLIVADNRGPRVLVRNGDIIIAGRGAWIQRISPVEYESDFDSDSFKFSLELNIDTFTGAYIDDQQLIASTPSEVEYLETLAITKV